MSCHCHDQGCGQSNQNHSCCGGNCPCSCHKQGSCSDPCGGDECASHMKHLLDIADMAWMEVLKEKIKEHILASDHKIDEIAKVVAETNHDVWKLKMGKAKLKEQFAKRLGDVCCDTKCSDGSCSTPSQGNKKPGNSKGY